MIYKKGDKVLYRETEYIDKTCECCGHNDMENITKNVKGIIEDTKLEFVYSVANDFILTDEVTTTNGKTTHKPYMPEIGTTVPETVYKIKGYWLTKNAIIKKIK